MIIELNNEQFDSNESETNPYSMLPVLIRCVCQAKNQSLDLIFFIQFSSLANRKYSGQILAPVSHIHLCVNNFIFVWFFSRKKNSKKFSQKCQKTKSKTRSSQVNPKCDWWVKQLEESARKIAIRNKKFIGKFNETSEKSSNWQPESARNWK